MLLLTNLIRSISLINTTCQLYGKIINERLRLISDFLLLDEQAGFRKGRSYIDDIILSLKNCLRKEGDILYRHALPSFTTRKHFIELTYPSVGHLSLIHI